MTAIAGCSRLSRRSPGDQAAFVETLRQPSSLLRHRPRSGKSNARSDAEIPGRGPNLLHQPSRLPTAGAPGIAPRRSESLLVPS